MKLLPEKLHVLGIVRCYFVMYLFPNEEMNLYLYPYFVIGYYARKREQEWKTCRRQGLWIAALLFSAMLFFFRDSCYIYASGITLWTSEHGWMTQLGIDLYRYAIGLAGSIVAMELAVRGVKRLPAVVTGAVTDCGKLSMQIYILQCFCLSWAWPKIWRKIVQSLGFHPLTGNLLLYWSITLAMAAAFMIILSAMIKSVKRRPQVHRFLFGR